MSLYLWCRSTIPMALVPTVPSYLALVQTVPSYLSLVQTVPSYLALVPTVPSYLAYIPYTFLDGASCWVLIAWNEWPWHKFESDALVAASLIHQYLTIHSLWIHLTIFRYYMILISMSGYQDVHIFQSFHILRKLKLNCKRIIYSDEICMYNLDFPLHI